MIFCKRKYCLKSIRGHAGTFATQKHTYEILSFFFELLHQVFGRKCACMAANTFQTLFPLTKDQNQNFHGYAILRGHIAVKYGSIKNNA